MVEKEGYSYFTIKSILLLSCFKVKDEENFCIWRFYSVLRGISGFWFSLIHQIDYSVLFELRNAIFGVPTTWDWIRWFISSQEYLGSGVYDTPDKLLDIDIVCVLKMCFSKRINKWDKEGHLDFMSSWIRIQSS